MKIILAACGTLFLLTLYLVGRVAMMDHCEIWHRGEPWTFLAVATVISSGITGFCYLAIPAHFAVFAWRIWRRRLPLWFSGLLILGVGFVLSCGMVHFDLVVARPVVYCTESLLVRLINSGLSLLFLAAFAVCAEALLLFADLVARTPLFAPLLGLRWPWETVAVMRRLAAEVGP